MEMGLDEQRMTVWQTFLRTYTTIIPTLECEMQKAQGLPLTWYNVLTHLNRASRDGVRLQDLAEAVVLSQSGLTRLLDRMAQAELVARKPCPHDRRGAYAVITPKGRAALEQAEPIHRRGIEQHFMQHLNDEDVQALNSVLQKILEAEKK